MYFASITPNLILTRCHKTVFRIFINLKESCLFKFQDSKMICQEAMSPSKIDFQAFQTYLQISSTKLELFLIIVPMHPKESCQLEFQVLKMICQEAVSPSKIVFLACQRHLQMAIIKPNSKIICQEAMSPSKQSSKLSKHICRFQVPNLNYFR